MSPEALLIGPMLLRAVLILGTAASAHKNSGESTYKGDFHAAWYRVLDPYA